MARAMAAAHNFGMSRARVQRQNAVWGSWSRDCTRDERHDVKSNISYEFCECRVYCDIPIGDMYGSPGVNAMLPAATMPISMRAVEYAANVLLATCTT